MRIKTILLSSAAIVTVTSLHVGAAGICQDNRYLCEPEKPAVETAAPPAAAPEPAPAVRAASEPRRRTKKHTARAKPTPRPAVATANPAERKKPGWNILTGTPTLERQRPAPNVAVVNPDELNALDLAADSVRVAAPAHTVRVVSPEEFNEIDRAAPPPLKRSSAFEQALHFASMQAVAAERPDMTQPATDGMAPQEVTNVPEQAPVETALLERVLLTFGSALGAASALRIFIG